MICEICFSAEPCHLFLLVDNTETSEVCQHYLKTQVSNMVVCEEKHIQACRLMVTLISVIELGICATKEATNHTKRGKLKFPWQLCTNIKIRSEAAMTGIGVVQTI